MPDREMSAHPPPAEPPRRSMAEDQALAQLKDRSSSPKVIEQIAQDAATLKSRKIAVALVTHPNTPRRILLPQMRRLYTFDLMRVAFSPALPADLKIVAEDILISRLETVTLGERLSLARRASGRVAAALLLENKSEAPGTEALTSQAAPTASVQDQIIQTALDNPRLTENLLAAALADPAATASMVRAVAQHPKWAQRPEVRSSILRTAHLALDHALRFSRELSAPQLQELLAHSKLPSAIKDQLFRLDSQDL